MLRVVFWEILVAVALMPGPCWAWSAKVVGISDGDTITVLRTGRSQVKVRLYGIDAPESDQPFGTASKKNLSSLVFGKKVDVEVMDTDRYGRTVARVSVQGEDVNAAQLRDGYAWLYRKYCEGWICLEWAKLEAMARSGKKGLWAEDAPIPPWEWRQAKKGRSSSWIDDFIALERVLRRIQRLLSSW